MTVPPHFTASIVAGGAAAIGWLATRGGDESEGGTDEGWTCTECGQSSTKNPTECENCGHTVFDFGPNHPRPGDERDGRSGEPVADAVVRKMGEYEGVRLEELDPLYDSVDPDALDAFVRNMNAGLVTFEYHGSEVTVTADGRVFIDGAS